MNTNYCPSVDGVSVEANGAHSQGPQAKVPVRVTNTSGVSFAPYFLPGNKQIIYSSNQHDPMGGDFQLFIVNIDGSGMKQVLLSLHHVLTHQVTTKGSFNSFPMLSFDGRKIAWCSNRDAAPGDYSTIDIYVADWVGSGLDESTIRRV